MSDSKFFLFIFVMTAIVGFLVGVIGAVVAYGNPHTRGRNEACASVCDGFGWWGDPEERCICAQEKL